MNYNELTDFEEINKYINIDKNIIVSVLCTTFNHVDYIRDALEGIVRQQTNFLFEVVIFDDASTDGTSDIIREYAQMYPNLIKAFIAKDNTYRHPQRKAFFLAFCKEFLRGKYIARCECDDYWIDRDKLQIQVDFLERHPECIMTTHSELKLECKYGKLTPLAMYKGDKYLSEKELVLSPDWCAQLSSWVYRRELVEYPEDFPSSPIGDIRMHLFALSKGKVYWFDRLMAVYRYRHPGSWTEKSFEDKAFHLTFLFQLALFYSRYNKYTKERFSDIIIRALMETLGPAILYKQAMSDEKYNLVKEGIEEIIVSLRNDNKDIDGVNNCLDRYMFDGFFTDDELSAIQKYEHIYIYGNGQHADCLKSVLNKNKVRWEGTVVSDSQNIANNCLDTVRHLSDIPHNDYKTICILAMHQKWEGDVMKEIKKMKKICFFAPFWIGENSGFIKMN